jgi:hypothetical protein
MDYKLMRPFVAQLARCVNVNGFRTLLYFDSVCRNLARIPAALNTT